MSVFSDEDDSLVSRDSSYENSLAAKPTTAYKHQLLLYELLFSETDVAIVTNDRCTLSISSDSNVPPPPP